MDKEIQHPFMNILKALHMDYTYTITNPEHVCRSAKLDISNENAMYECNIIFLEYNVKKTSELFERK